MSSPTGSTEPRRRRRPALWAGLALVIVGSGFAAWQLAHGPRLAASRDEPRACPAPAEAANAPHPGMAWVPAGTVELGDDVYPEEQPRRRVAVAGFWIDRTEVTNDDFAAFVAATGYVTVAERPLDAATHRGVPAEMLQPGAVVFVMPAQIDGLQDVRQWWRYVPGANWRHPGGPGTTIEGRGRYPVVAVAHEDALAYARWKGRALPTEAQWEWAARSGRRAASDEHGQPADANTWQGAFPVQNSAADGFVGLAPVGCFHADVHGLHDLIGNAWELTADRWTPDHSAAVPDDPPPGQRAGSEAARHVIKGGSFLCAPNYCMRYRAGSRQPQDDDLASSHVGFRTVLAAPGP